jgi:putative ABC transport system permease protein
MIKDLQFAFRQLVKQPGFSATAILTLAIGIGANTAIFSIVNAVLLRPLPYPHPGQLVLLRERLVRPSGFESGSVSYMNYLDWRAAQRSFTDLALVRRENVNVSNVGASAPPERLGAARITGNYLSVLQVAPLIGRDLLEKDDVPGAGRVALISERFWRSRFGALPTVVGQRLNIDGMPREIVGVVPERVDFPRDSDFFLPLADLRADHDILSRGNHTGFSALGRLKPHATLKQAGVDLDMIAVDLARRYPDSNGDRQVSAKPLLEFAVGDYRHLLYFLLAAVGCVLLIACANVANLHLTRAITRTKELAIRAALGGSRWRLARQILIETGVIALLGGCLATLVALWSLDAIRAITPANVSRFQETNIDLMVLLFTTGVMVVAAILVGLWPVLRVFNSVSMANDLHDNGARASEGISRQRARSILVVAQVALAVVLLSAAGLTLKSFRRAQQVPLGFNPLGVLTMRITEASARYNSPEKIARFYDQLLGKLRVLPGVSAVANCSDPPFETGGWDSSFHITGTPPGPPGNEPISAMNIVSPDYFRVLGMSIVRGRTFTAQDIASGPRVMIIDELAAQRFFPRQDPIGKQIDDPVTIGEANETGAPITIVGIVSHARLHAPGDQYDLRKLPVMYFSAAQFPTKHQTLIVRAADGYDPYSLVRASKRAIASVDPEQAVSEVATLDENISQSLAPRRLSMTLLGVFAGLALCLASVGLYGVMGLAVTQRTRELGIRLALGASRGDVVRLVLGQGAVLVGIGLAAGLLGALVASRALGSLLYNVAPLDPIALVGALLTLSLVALMACFLPARRASLVDPIEALRME